MVFRGVPSADELLNRAMTKRYTNNGEMFSAAWLLELMKENLSCSNATSKPDKIRSYIYDGNLETEFIKEKLKQHSVLLVPYDADRNHSPCNQNGHKAHWCLILGYLIDDNNDVSNRNRKLVINLNQLKVRKCFLAKFRRNYILSLLPFKQAEYGSAYKMNKRKFSFKIIFFRCLILVPRFCTTRQNQKPGIIFVERLE
jgi:hypothetical protein